MEARQHGYLSVEEYLLLEETSPVRHEYIGGTLQAKAGASAAHNQIAGNIFGHLWSAARGSACRVFMSDMLLRVSDEVLYYPDVMVTCDPADRDRRMVRNPCLVVEVLSPTSSQVDLREKLLAYRALPGLDAYVIVWQDARRIQRHWRDERGAWWLSELSESGRVALPCPQLELALSDLYEGVFEADPTAGV
jgi:Uma2 family endonuclease